MKGWTWLLAVGTFAAMACGDDDGAADAATPDTGTTDAGDTDGGGGADAGSGTELPLLMNGDGADPVDPTGIGIDPASSEPANMSCFGMTSVPVGGAEVDFTLRIQEFRTDDVLEGLCVKFYTDNMPVPGDTCDSRTDLITAADGTVSVRAPAGGWYAYRVFPKEGPSPSLQIAGSVQINEPAPESPTAVQGNSVSQATLNLIPTVLGFMQQPGTALIAGTVFDCDETPVYGAVVRVFREDGSEIVEGMRSPEPHYRYFDGDDFPKSDQPWTHTDGIFTLANVPVAADGEFVFVEVWGRRAEGAEPEVIGCERLPLFADTISIVNMMPLRERPPACPNL